MPYNLFLLPIITGYLILIFSVIFKFNIQRLSRNRILFESVALGILITFSGFIIRTIVELTFPNLLPALIQALEIVPIQKSNYLWTIVFSSLIFLALVLISNIVIRIFYKKNELIAWAVDQNGDEIEKLFKNSVEQGFSIQVTLKNNKVYIGFSETIPIPQKTNYLTLTPLLSGYRDNDTKQLHITTDYFKIVNEFIEDLENEGEEPEIITLNTDVIIKQDEILTAGIFEQKIFEKFNES